MKIQFNQRVPEVVPPDPDRGNRTAGSQHPQETADPAAQVSRSAFASALTDVEPAEVRRELVDSVRAAIANGTFEATVDMDAVIDSLLADL